MPFDDEEVVIIIDIVGDDNQRKGGLVWVRRAVRRVQAVPPQIPAVDAGAAERADTASKIAERDSR